MITVEALTEWAKRELTDPATKDDLPYAARGGGFWIVMDGESCKENYGVDAVVLRTSHCSDCGQWFLILDDGVLRRPVDIYDSDKGMVVVEDLNALKFEDFKDGDE